jgi:hypothetical protein
MRRHQTGIFCIIILLALALAAPVAAQEPVIVRVAPAVLNLAVGAASDVAVEVVDVSGLYGFDVQLSFDPDVVEVVDADPDKAGVQVSLGRMLDSGMAVRDSADNEAGTIHYAMTQINPSEAKSGTGNLIVIRLRGTAAGTASLAFTSVDLARRDATAIDNAPQPGAVTVLAEGSTQPTTTPIPTQAPPTPIHTALPAAAQGTQAQPAATATLPATATPTAQVPPTATAQAPTDLPPTRAPEATTEAGTTLPAATTSAAAVSATSLATQEPTPLPVAAAAIDATAASPDQPTLAPVDPTATPQAIAVAPPGDQGGSAAAAAAADAQASRSPEQTLLLVGVGALLLAGLLGAGLLLAARRRTAAP